MRMHQSATGSEGLAACRTMAYASWSWSARRHSIDMKCCVLGQRRTGSNTRVLQGKAAHAFHWRPVRMNGGDLSGRTPGGSKRLRNRRIKPFLYQIRIFTNEYRTSSNLEQRGLVLRCRMKEPKLCERRLLNVRYYHSHRNRPMKKRITSKTPRHSNGTPSKITASEHGG